jgi:hypothetical protein
MDMFNALLDVVVVLWPPCVEWSLVEECSYEACGAGFGINIYCSLESIACDALRQITG